MSAGRSAAGSVWRVPGSWAKSLHGVSRALAQMKRPRAVRTAFDAIAEGYCGADAVQAQRVGVVFSLRSAATRYGCHKTHMQRGDWDGGYDVDLFPSYGEHWQTSGRPWVETLGRLGVHAAAGRQEDFMRSRRPVATARGRASPA